jgi:hypothetical protein
MTIRVISARTMLVPTTPALVETLDGTEIDRTMLERAPSPAGS